MILAREAQKELLRCVRCAKLILVKLRESCRKTPRRELKLAPAGPAGGEGERARKRGRDLIDDEHRDASIEVLHRMIAYIRAEALRLRVMDVALLLEHAEDAVTAFAPVPPRGPVRAALRREADRVEH